MDVKQREKIAEVIRLCNEKVEDQRRHEAGAGYGEDYADGRVEPPWPGGFFNC